MDSDGLPLVGPGLDLTKVSAINQKRILAFLNHYLTNTVQYLNRFSCVCEEKLTDISIKIQRLETTMNILEAKLSSIPGLENITVERQQPSSTPTSTEVSSEPSTATTSTNDQTSRKEPDAVSVKEELGTEPAAHVMTVSQDPRYARFFKMIQLGVPEMAIKQKMSIEGFDPDILDNPNAPSNAAGSGTTTTVTSQSQNDDDSDDFSDEAPQESSTDADDDSDAFSD